MEYIFTNLPQYVRITPRSDFSSSVVSSGAVLLFSEDGLTLTGKLPDGTFITIGGSSGTDVSSTTAEASDVLSPKIFYTSGGVKTSGTIPTVSATSAGSQINVPSGYIAAAQTFNISSGAEVTLGYITSGGQFQPLSFSGTSAADSGSAVTLSCYSWNLPTFTSGVIVSSGMSLYVSAPLNYISTTINNGGHMYVLSGGTATNTILEATGYLHITSGGTAIGGTASSGGVMNILEGGSAYGFNMAAGGLSVEFTPQTYVSGTLRGSTVFMSGTSIQLMTFHSGLAVHMGSGTYAENVTITSDTQINFDAGASGASIVASGSYAYVRAESGGSIGGVYVYSGAELNVHAEGAAYNVSAYSGGNFRLYDGSITSARILAGGAGYVAAYGGTLSDAVVSSGGSLILSAGTASNITVSSGGTLTIYSNAVTENIISDTGAVIIDINS